MSLLKKKLKLILPLIILMGMVFPFQINVAHAQFGTMGSVISTTAATVGTGILSTIGNLSGANPVKWTVDKILVAITWAILKLVSLILSIVGALLEYIVQFTVVEMSDRFSSDTSKFATMGSAISEAWGAMRDIANLAFIFVLLWAAIKVILDLNVASIGNTVKNIIIVGLLINFSMFLTKVVIDASNIATVGFYNSIQQSVKGASADINGYQVPPGIASAVMNATRIQTIYGPEGLKNLSSNDDTKIYLSNTLGSVLILIISVVFLIISVMFISRFVLLILIVVTSSAAAVAWVLPGLRNHWNTWLNSLIGQASFAPAFMLMMWISLKLMIALRPVIGPNGQFSTLSGSPISSAGLVLNYCIVLGFVIASLTIAKQMASKSAGFSTINKYVGTGMVGTAAWGLRNTAGRTGNWIAKRDNLKLTAEKGSNIFTRTGARLALYTGDKAAKSTFDARNATIPTSVVGDAIRGTVGRTGWGKKIGLNDVNTESIKIGSTLVGKDLGAPGSKGFKELQDESKKRVREREAATAAEVRMIENKQKVIKGKDATPGSPEFDEMEKALAKMSEKETEALVSSNRDLLESMNFANAINVKQLEAINKSDQFSEGEKDKLKNSRFAQIADITDAAGIAALAVPAPTRTPAQAAAAKKVEDARTKVKGLSDSELDMISSNYLDPSTPEGKEFISQLRAGQAENIINNKSGKFTSTQKEAVKRERIRPLIDALAAGRIRDVQNMVKKTDVKTLVTYMKVPGRGGINIGLDPAVLPIYTPQTLTRMAAQDAMTDSDISTLRAAILGAGLPATHPTVVWLNDPAKGMVQFPP